MRVVGRVLGVARDDKDSPSAERQDGGQAAEQPPLERPADIARAMRLGDVAGSRTVRISTDAPSSLR